MSGADILAAMGRAAIDVVGIWCGLGVLAGLVSAVAGFVMARAGVSPSDVAWPKQDLSGRWVRLCALLGFRLGRRS